MNRKGIHPVEELDTESPVKQSLEGIFSGCPVGTGLVKSRTILEVNDRLCEMTGYSRSELIGYSELNLYPSHAEFERVEGEISTHIGKTGTSTIETVWKRKDGMLMNVLLGSSPLDRTDAQKGFTFAALVIPERKPMKNSEEANAALLRIAGETARFGGWSVDLETNTCTWSDAVCDIHGTPRGFSPTADEAMGFYAPEWRETIIRVFSACAAEGIPYDEELEIISRNGRRTWVKTLGRPVRDSSGTVVKVQGSFQDISEQKKAEEQLRDNTERMDFLLKATGTNINIMNADYSLSYVDERWQKVYGDYEGMKCYRYFMGRDNPCEGCGVPEALETRQTVVTEEFLPKEDRFVEVHTIPFQEKDGNWMLAEFNIDITKRRRAEEEREKLRFQLMQVRKMESVGRLAGGVAHDFNNMLGVILGNAEITLDKIDPSMPIYEELTEIRSAAKRSADLTRQLLTFARKQTIAPRLIDLNETVEGMLQMLRRLVGENITLNWNAGCALLPVKLDPSQLDQLLANLVVNARDAIDGVGFITIETAAVSKDGIPAFPGSEPEPGSYVSLEITDNGCGMDEETRQHIFEPFYTTKAPGGGTGLGLATVYGIVKQNGGYIDVHSEPEAGTTIKVFLPGQPESAAEQTAMKSQNPPAGGSETVLLVEDEVSVLKMTKTILENLGYRVMAAETPGKALKLASEHEESIDLLLTDVVMPEMNGRVLAYSLTSDHPNLRCLFMSGYAADVMERNNTPCGAGLCFIHKPFTVAELAEAVRKAIDNG